MKGSITAIGAGWQSRGRPDTDHNASRSPVSIRAGGCGARGLTAIAPLARNRKTA